MGKEILRGLERLRSGGQLQIPTFTNVAAATAAGVTAAKFPRRIIHFFAGAPAPVVPPPAVPVVESPAVPAAPVKSKRKAGAKASPK